jgi:hypothetical protein
MGKLSRTKGHSFEREVAIALRPVYPEARRHLEYQDAEANGVDLINTGPYRVQCKRGRKPSPISAIKEITADELMGEVPVLVTQGDRDRVYAVIPFEEFLFLIGALKK